MVTVYSKPSCPQCNATKTTLTNNGVPFTVRDVSQDADALETVQRLGYSGVPVVVAGNEHWSGFRPDRIKALAERAA